jgi:hypothetical protein
MDQDALVISFRLGIKVAEYVHGTSRKGDDKKTDAIFSALRAVADGELTLLDTPEEIIASLPSPPKGVKLNIGPEFYERIRQGREEQMAVAETLLNMLPK